MAYWLFKSEPGAWSWDQQVQKGDTGEGWDGVRNYQAANNMKAMNIGDLGFFYHSVAEKQIVGIVDVIAPYHPDPTDASGRFGMVTVRAIAPMVRPVRLLKLRHRSLWLRLLWCVRHAYLWCLFLQKNGAISLTWAGQLFSR